MDSNDLRPERSEQIQTQAVEPVVKPRRNRTSAKKAGAAFESVVAEFLSFALADDRIERRKTNGTHDRGDIAGVRTIRGGRVVIECKNVRGLALKSWLDQAEVERGNDDAAIGVVAHKAHGNANPADQLVTMSLDTFARLLEGGPEFGGVTA